MQNVASIESAPRAPRPASSRETFTARGLIEALALPIAILSRNGIVASVNEAWKDDSLLGGGGDWKGRTYVEICQILGGAANCEALADGFGDVLRGTAESFEPSSEVLALARGRQVVVRRAGRSVVVSVSGDAHATAAGALGLGEQRFRSLVQHGSDIITVVGADGRIIYQSPSVRRVLGRNPEQLIGRRFLDFVHPDDYRWLRAVLAKASDYPEATPEGEFRFRHNDGSWRYLEALSNNLLADPAVAGIVITSRDVTERKAFEEQLSRQAFFDPLTGLPNRAHFMERLEHAFRAASPLPPQIAILFIDVDRFKVVNDSLGHAAGDDLLREVAKRLVGCVRNADAIARFGGDEFTVLVSDLSDAAEARSLADRIVSALRAPFRVDGHDTYVTLSIGIALCSRQHSTPADLLRDADVAVYRAKSSGRNRYVVFERQMNAGAVQRLDLESDLRRALDRGQIKVHYQPEIDLRTGKICGMEALARWEHPREGLLSPIEFIPLAEENGLISTVGEFVLAEACNQAYAWQRQFPDMPRLGVSVNISPWQFRQAGLVDAVSAVLKTSGLDPIDLRLEITESAALDDSPEIVGSLTRLKALGVDLAIDDFGMGYSSLNYLTRLPVRTLKIDRSFVAGLPTNEESTAIVDAVISLARGLGLGVTAEGIESREQLDHLVWLRCDRAQGYYFSRPLAAETMATLLGVGLEERIRTRLNGPMHRQALPFVTPPDGQPVDYYEALGVARDAGFAAIEEAYSRRAAALGLRLDDPDASRALALANEAFAILSKPARRRHYDSLLPPLRSPTQQRRGLFGIIRSGRAAS
jgi:diguanylate cyclase (GGDEF)-like protein/PAS domain S-box-containing protein